MEDEVKMRGRRAVERASIEAMSHEPGKPGPVSFWHELRRRGVDRAGGVYVAAAFILLQLGEIVLPAFNAPDWVLQTLVVFVFLGLPVALAFSWVFDLTPEGLKRTRALARAGKGTVVPQLALLGVSVVSLGLGALWFSRGALSVAEDGGVSGAPDPGVSSFASIDPDAPITAVAVLPLADFAEDDDFFARQLHEELITQLSRLTSLRVVSRTSVERYATTDKLLPEIAAELRVQAIVTGSVAMTTESDSVRISIQLLHAPSDTHMLSRSFQREMKDILRLQTEVAVEIARAVQGELGDEMIAEVGRIAEVDPEAHRAVLMGQSELELGTPEGLTVAEGHFERARDADSTFAPAWAQLAGTRVLKGLEGLPLSEETVAQVMDEIRRAAELGGAEEQVNAATTLLGRYFDGMSDPAGQRVMFGLDSILGPGFAPDSVARTYALESTRIGRRGRSPSRFVAARQFLEAGQYDSASAAYTQILEADPLAGPAWSGLEAAHWLSGDFLGVVSVLADRIFATQGESSESQALVRELREAVDEGDPVGYWEWRRQYDSIRLDRGERVSDVELAVTAVGLSDIDGALRYLESAVEKRDPALATLRNNPMWDPIRRDPRFREIATRIGAFLRGERGAPGGRRGGGGRPGARGPG